MNTNIIRNLGATTMLAGVLASAAQAQLPPLPVDPALALLTGRVGVLETTTNLNTLDIDQLQTDVQLAAQAQLDLADRVTLTEADVVAVQLDLDQIVIDVDANTNAIVGLTGDLADISDDVVELQGTVGTLQTTVDGFQAGIDGLAAQVTLNTDGVAAIGTTVNGLTGQVGTLAADLGQTTARITATETGLAANVAALGGLTGQVTINSGLIAGLADQVTDATTIVNAIDGRVTITEGAVSILNTQVAGNTTAITNLTTQVAGNTTAIVSLDARLGANDARDDGQDTRITTVENRVTRNDARDDAQDVAIASNTAGLGQLRSDVDAGRAGLVRQADLASPVTVAATTGGSSVSFAGTGGDRRLTGVADGTAATDAANMRQVSASAAATLASANGYTDRSVAGVMANVSDLMSLNNVDLRRDIRAIASGTTAIAGLPQSFIPGRGMVGMSIGGTGGEMAFALGVSKAFAGAKPVVLRGGLAFDARRGDATYNLAAGIHF